MPSRDLAGVARRRGIARPYTQGDAWPDRQGQDPPVVRELL